MAESCVFSILNLCLYVQYQSDNGLVAIGNL